MRAAVPCPNGLVLWWWCVGRPDRFTPWISNVSNGHNGWTDGNGFPTHFYMVLDSRSLYYSATSANARSVRSHSRCTGGGGGVAVRFGACVRGCWSIDARTLVCVCVWAWSAAEDAYCCGWCVGGGGARSYEWGKFALKIYELILLFMFRCVLDIRVTCIGTARQFNALVVKTILLNLYWNWVEGHTHTHTHRVRALFRNETKTIKSRKHCRATEYLICARMQSTSSQTDTHVLAGTIPNQSNSVCVRCAAKMMQLPACASVCVCCTFRVVPSIVFLFCRGVITVSENRRVRVAAWTSSPPIANARGCPPAISDKCTYTHTRCARCAR